MEKDKAVEASSKTNRKPSKTKSNSNILLVSALDMSWRLAITVLIPIIGGFELDKHLGITPALTAVGFVIAMIGVFMILRRTLAGADDRFNSRGAGR